MRRSHCNRLPGLSRGTSAVPSIPAFIATSFVYPRANMTDAQATAQMAEDMRQAAYREGGVSELDLEILGFTPRQIRELSGHARRVAQARSVATA